MKRGDEFTILLEHTELMGTRASGSEEALATMTHERLGEREGAEWLIGGYGMGFTLRAALGCVASDASITVAEIVPEIIEWARGPMHVLTDGCLDDPRVMLINGDVAMLIDSAREAYDAILLDVDNGPDGLTREVNDELYHRDGLQAAMAALRHGGILAIWSAEHDDIFAKRLRDTGFDVDEVIVREVIDERDLDANGEKGGRHIIWFAQKP